MSVSVLNREAVERVWGRHVLPDGFADLSRGADAPIGEVWFREGPRQPLLVKYLFTSERLSIQVHPGDAAAALDGEPRGKDEAWLIVDAQPGARIGLGLRRRVEEAELRQAAQDGSIEDLLDWMEVRPGDSFFVPAGTVHAIGGGLSLVEVQQNADITYRLYDYGRPRDLHVERALRIAERRPWVPRPAPEILAGRQLLAAGGAFVLERWRVDGRFKVQPDAQALIIPLQPGAQLGATPLALAQVYAVEGTESLVTGGPADLLVTYAAREVQQDLLEATDHVQAPPRRAFAAGERRALMRAGMSS